MTTLTTIESLLAYSPFERGALVQAYDEKTFRHFFALERRRAGQSARSFLLVLVGLKQTADVAPGIAPVLADRLFANLSASVREVDFVGWYREGRVIGAVLTQGAEPSADALPLIAKRVTAMLGKRLPTRISRRIDVRVIPVRGSVGC